MKRGVEQLAARQAHNLQVGGSNPLSAKDSMVVAVVAEEGNAWLVDYFFAASTQAKKTVLSGAVSTSRVAGMPTPADCCHLRN